MKNRPYAPTKAADQLGRFVAVAASRGLWPQIRLAIDRAEAKMHGGPLANGQSVPLDHPALGLSRYIVRRLRFHHIATIEDLEHEEEDYLATLKGLDEADRCQIRTAIAKYHDTEKKLP